MHTFNIRIVTMTIALVFSGTAMARSISTEEYQLGRDRIAAERKSARDACVVLSGNSKDVCVAQADGKEKVAKAELESRFKPSLKSFYYMKLAKAEADYGVAKERCDDLSGNAKDVCVKRAKAVETAAEKEAKAQVKKKARALDASGDTLREANYAMAKQRCDAFNGDAKDRCINEAKGRYGK